MIVLPVVILVLLLAIQGALYFHISHVAGAAAAYGASAASAKSLTTTGATIRGRERADALVRDSGTTLAAPTNVTVANADVSVTVAAVVPRIVPFFPEVVSRTVVEPRERFLTEVQR